MKGTEIDRGELLDELWAVYTELDRPPKIEDLHQHAAYSYETYRRRFGGIADALEAADITPDPSAANRGPGAIDQEELLEDLQRLGDELGRTPTLQDVEREGRYSQVTYYNRFESFTAALAAAGFDAEPGNRISRAELIGALHSLADEVGGVPTVEQMREHGRYSPKPYRRAFGSWVDALNVAGLNE